jgi:stage VI sporulation protein D
LSQENQSCLRFSLEETLWFRKGQEVEELVSISLDPDITIQESDQYVTIRGSLELSGEYKSYDAGNDSGEDGKASQKFVERVAELEEGNCEFSHRFPVDITIPNNRIQSIYDIDVLVESFDYSFPERSCLKLSAELTISGLYGSEPEQEEAEELELLHRADIEDEVEEINVEEPVAQSRDEDNFLFTTEARKQQEDQPVEFPKYPNFSYQPQEQYEADPYRPSWNYQEARNEGKHVEVEIEEEIVVEDVPDEEVYFEKGANVDESSSSSDEAPKKKKKKLFAKKKSMTLTEFFARKDEGQAQTRLKMCIVQKGDTVESLAERYDVTTQHLLRVNNLEINQDVYEGQVLYIPAALAKK